MAKKKGEAPTVPELSTKHKRLELIRLWEDTFSICMAIVTEAKKDPLTVKPSMLKEVLAMLKQSTTLLNLIEMAEGEVLAQQLQDQNNGMTPEEKTMVDEFEELERAIVSNINSDGDRVDNPADAGGTASRQGEPFSTNHDPDGLKEWGETKRKSSRTKGNYSGDF